MRVQENEQKEQGQGNSERHDHRSSNANQKSHQYKKNKGHPKQHVAFDRVDGELHKVAAIVIGEDFYVGWQVALVEFEGFFFDALQHILRLLAAPHHDDALDGIIRFVEPEFAQAWGVPDGDLSDVSNAYRGAVLRTHYDVANIRGVVDQAEASDVIELIALRSEERRVGKECRSRW